MMREMIAFVSESTRLVINCYQASVSVLRKLHLLLLTLYLTKCRTIVIFVF